ncbi:uncharacterized protein LOC118488270 [Helianthus annuus]|uniref:uncharacterized protein LOC118488270 n=1 Tax=Helianthus annuus TaxID=4232 RepID=UPI001652F4EF|nr:uncharacterized protein LOC118488270 [Helianthus annuus]
MSSFFPFPHSAPPPVFDPSAYYPPAHMSAQAQAYSAPHLSSPYIPIPTPQPPPQVNTTQPQFDPRAYIPVPSQPQVQSQTFGSPFDPNAYIPKPSQAQPQQGNQNPFRNQTSTSTSNSNQTDERCDWSVQCGGGDQGGTVFYAEIVKNVSDGDSSGKDDSSGYSGRSDEESNLNERTDSEADNLPNDANKKSDLIKKADLSLMTTQDFSWVVVMAHKSESPEILKNLLTLLENLYTLKVKRIRSDNVTEFKNQVMDELCTSKGILHEYISRYTPQQNGVAERKNRTLIETARTMLVESELPVQFWGRLWLLLVIL